MVDEPVSEAKEELRDNDSLASAVRVLEKIEGASEQLIFDALGSMKDAVSHGLEALHITHQTEQLGTSNEPMNLVNEKTPESGAVREVTEGDSLEKMENDSEQLTAVASGKVEETIPHI